MITSMGKKIKTIVVSPGGEWSVREVHAGLKPMQELVGGYVELVPLGCGICALCNEEGKVCGLPLSFCAGNLVLVGTVCICRYEGGSWKSLRDNDIELYSNILGRDKRKC